MISSLPSSSEWRALITTDALTPSGPLIIEEQSRRMVRLSLLVKSRLVCSCAKKKNFSHTKVYYFSCYNTTIPLDRAFIFYWHNFIIYLNVLCYVKNINIIIQWVNTYRVRIRCQGRWRCLGRYLACCDDKRLLRLRDLMMGPGPKHTSIADYKEKEKH